MNFKGTNCDDFALVWTVGFSGKRYLADETKAARAIASAVEFLQQKAKVVEARLTAISSLARGGDVLFAEAAQRAGLPWQCILPFGWADFLQRDLALDASGQPLMGEERGQRETTATNLRQQSFTLHQPREVPDEDPEEVSRRVNVADSEARDTAYQDCSYRNVDEADVMIILLTHAEFTELIQGGGSNIPSAKAGALSTAQYARAARRPCILLNAEAEDPWAAREFLNDPEKETPEPGQWMCDPITTPLVLSALRRPWLDKCKEVPGETAALRCVRSVMDRLGDIAGEHQGKTQKGLKKVLLFHLVASLLAALSATVLGFHAGPLLLLLAILAIGKSTLVFGAFRLESDLHHHQHRDQWLHARILSELCRSVLAVWPLPLQPDDVHDEEDFPKCKRLLRTLRILRSLEKPPTGSTIPEDRRPGETTLEHAMRHACARYADERLITSQAVNYFAQRKGTHLSEEHRYRSLFQGALTIAMAAGLILAGLNGYKYYLERKVEAGAGEQVEAPKHGAAHGATPVVMPGAQFEEVHHEPASAHTDATAVKGQHRPGEHVAVNPLLSFEKWLEAILIMAPFIASWALGKTTLLDSRRRAHKYPQMESYLHRVAATIKACSSNPSRLRLIEQAERRLIEEQHEWFSTMWNANI